MNSRLSLPDEQNMNSWGDYSNKHMFLWVGSNPTIAKLFIKVGPTARSQVSAMFLFLFLPMQQLRMQRTMIARAPDSSLNFWKSSTIDSFERYANVSISTLGLVYLTGGGTGSYIATGSGQRYFTSTGSSSSFSSELTCVNRATPNNNKMIVLLIIQQLQQTSQTSLNINLSIPMENDIKHYYKEAQTEKNFFTGVKFLNPFPLFKQRKMEFMKTASFMYANYKCQLDPAQLKQILPAKIISPEKLINKDGVLRAVWIGHATVLIQDGPVNFITDPIFNVRVPDAFYGFKRLNPLPIQIQSLPKIHGVILSHDHHDHCNVDNLKQLHDRFHCDFFAGKQSADMFPKAAKVHQMNWTEMVEFSAEGRTYKIYFVPACHWSGRAVADHFKRLWGGFVIVTPQNKKIYYSGDTGYCEIFKEIGEHFEQIDLALIPIGAYNPREFLQFQHIDPHEAVKVHKDINCKQSLAIHWATFQLACEKALEPRQELEASLEKLGVKEEDFVAFFPGNILTCKIPVLRPVFELKNPNQITFFGHSTVLLQLSNLNILINPVFSNRLQYRTRYTDFPCKAEDLPKIDIILINQQINEEELVKLRLSGSLVMTNKNIQSSNRIKESVWEKGDIKIKLQISQHNSSFFIHYREDIYQIPENLKEQPKIQQQTQIKFLLLSIRPFDNAKFDMEHFIKKYEEIDPKTLIPVNWGSFEYRDENIIKPLEDIQKYFPGEAAKDIMSRKIFVPVIGKTVSV